MLGPAWRSAESPGSRRVTDAARLNTTLMPHRVFCVYRAITDRRGDLAPSIGAAGENEAGGGTLPHKTHTPKRRRGPGR